MKASEFGCNCDGANFSQPNTPAARSLNDNQNPKSLKANSYMANPLSEYSEQTRFPSTGQKTSQFFTCPST
ncbi:hypothetical protein A2U01_0060302, partial [Trifolium medium]|nr:hypothetical protein [Trifolium medium]